MRFVQSIVRETPCIEKTFFDAFMWVYRIKGVRAPTIREGVQHGLSGVEEGV